MEQVPFQATNTFVRSDSVTSSLESSSLQGWGANVIIFSLIFDERSFSKTDSIGHDCVTTAFFPVLVISLFII